MKEFLNRNFYQMLGYAGVLPFLFFLIGFYLNQGNIIIANLMLVMQMFYAAVILGFLSGIHWSDAVRTKNKIRLILSVLPTILLLPIVFWGMSHSPIQALLMIVFLFWGVFVMDRGYFYYRADSETTMPRRYILYRFNLTMLVTIILGSTYWIAS